MYKGHISNSTLSIFSASLLSAFILVSFTIIFSDQKVFAGTETNPPTGTIQYNSGDMYTNSDVVLSLTCTDNEGSGCETAIITVTNFDPDLTGDVDFLDAYVTTTSDTEGYAGSFVETGDTTGIFQLSINLDAGENVFSDGDTLTVEYTGIGDAIITAEAVFIDFVENDSTPISDSIRLDTTAPTTSINPEAIDGDSNIVEDGGTTSSTSINIEFDANDPEIESEVLGSGVVSTECKLDDGSFIECNGDGNFVDYTDLDDGIHTVTFESTDGVGNREESPTFTWTIDTTNPTTVILDPIADPFTGDVFTVTGRLVDDDTGLGIPGKIVAFDDTGAVADLEDATTSGFTVTDIANGITIEDVSGDNILRPEIGTMISFSSNPTFVILSLKDMETNEIEVLVTPGGESGTFSPIGLGPGINIGIFTISHPDGISSIEVIDISDTGIAGITRVQALNSEQVQYIDEEFADSTACEDEECDLPDTLSFAEGSFYSIGTASATPATDLIVDAHFDGDESYDASETEPCEEDCDTNVQTYSVLSSTAGGVGGTVSVTADTGLGRTSILCAAGNDNDKDALCNDWETTGIPYSGGTYVLAGANPDRTDVYVEIDYMPGRNPFVTGASNDAIDDVIAAFAAAPFTNGVNLHVDQGEQVPNVSPLIVWTDLANDLDDFNTYKATYFGTSAERANVNLLNAKAQAYRYFLFADSIGGSSGIAELRGNDAVVALGTGFAGDRNQYAGTFMHELGHLLNLNHGGPQYLITDVTQRTIADQGVNCKPNHDSIMSYSRQLPTLLGASWRLDYSDGGLGPSAGLRETTLAETAGNLVHTPDTFRPGLALPIIIWGTPGQAQTFLTQVSRVSAGTPANIDWSGENSISTTAVSRDINNFGITGCAASGPTTTFYKNYDEWRNLDFNFRQGPSGQFDGNDADVNSYPLVINDYDVQTVAELKSISSYHNALFPWKADSSLTLKKGLPIPIDVRLFDGANVPIVKGDGTVSYKLYKSGDNTVKASGSLVYDKFITKSWVTAIHPSKITSKGTWFIEITFTNTAGSHVTKDQLPSTNPVYTNPIPGDPDPLMSLKVIVK